ncbi:MAG TPA: efflux transporter outer membrane subunit, partial [Vicinamibacterales bacterium]|nr:efflux transporter outer membrane subunit [Vicinamibacterales bacterium]
DQWKMATPLDDLAKGKWWEIFGDQQLNQLEERVDVDNQNLKQAEAQFRQARSVVAGNRANYYPTIGVSPTVTQTSVGVNAGRGVAGTFVTYALPVDVAWEPDLWGRVRLSVEGAIGSAQASAADLENVRLSEQALLATDYFSLAAVDMQEELLAATIAAYAQNLKLTTDRFNAGVASRSDVTLAEAQLAGAQAQSTDLRATRAQFEDAIAVLTGRPPAEVQIGDSRIAGPPPPVPTAIPSELLERRPDISASERLVAVANANVGLAEVAYYPTLQLSANPALIATTVRSFFAWASRSWTGSAQLSETVADFGRRRAALQGARAAYDAAVAAYQQTVLSAFQEVEDNLANLRYLAEESGQQQQAVAAAQQSLNLEMDRYRAGTDSYLNVIQTQTILLGDQQTAVTILQRRLTAAVGLIKAVGGGWTASMLPSPASFRSGD